MARQSLSLILENRPGLTGDIEAGKTFKKNSEPAPTEADLKDGQILVESLYLGLDPAMRGWLKDRRSYMPPVQIGEVMRGGVIGRVLASKTKKAKAGDIVYNTAGWREVAILNEQQFEDPLELPPNGKITDLLGVLGGTGLTAFFGITKVADIKEGDTVVISGAAGATGSVAGQLAKARGARVVGIAGSDDKCQWLKEELGFDEALNYKAGDFKEKLTEATPKFIDVFWDNVGGEILDLALNRAAKNARFVQCGGVSQYNATSVYGIKNIHNVITQRIKMQGFIVFDHVAEYGSARKELAQLLADGKIKRRETIIKGGLDAAEGALINLFKGVNTGKLMVEIKNPEEGSKL